MKHVLKGTEYLTLNDINGEVACTPFKYPDGEFFEDKEEKGLKPIKERIYKNFIATMNLLNDKEHMMVILRLINPKMSLREIASNINTSHEYARKRIKRIRKLYPNLYKKIVNN